MNIYLVSNPKREYETYTNMLIAADNVSEAIEISFTAEHISDFSNKWVAFDKKESLIVKLIGVADASIEKGIIVEHYKEG